MTDGCYGARNGARDAPLLKNSTDGSTLGEDFPMLCETCLGPNPYVRMTKFPYGSKLCKISNLPFQAFKWKAGPGGRHKETLISYAVAAERNICQCCLNDMVFGLPVGIRDAILNNKASSSSEIALPNSAVGQQYYYEQQAAMIASGNIPTNDLITDATNIAKARQLDQFSRSLHHNDNIINNSNKVAFRNLPKLCSFWLNGGCTRVLRKTCPYRPCCGTYLFPEIAGSHNELCKQLITNLQEKGPAVMQKELDDDTRKAIQESQRGNRDDSIRKRVSGEDDLSKKYLGKMKNMQLQLEPPSDQSIITLWIGGIESDITESDLRSVIYPFGQISAIHMVPSAKCAFVEYIDREAAESAATQMYRALTVKGRSLNVNWAKPKVSSTNAVANESKNGVLLPPPGMENMPVSAYALPNTVNVYIPPPPAGPPPTSSLRDGSNGSNKRQKISNEQTVNKVGGAMALLGGYGDDDDEDDEERNNNITSERTEPVQPSMQYPSMNPNRMGSKV